MTIVFLTASVSRQAGGLFVSVRRLAQEISACPHAHARVVTLQDKHTEADLPAWHGLPVTVCRPYGPVSFGYSSELLTAVKSANPDLMHVHGLWMYPSLISLRWSQTTRRPFILSPRGMLEPWALGNSAWKKRLAGWLYQNRHLREATCLHALCEAEARAIRAHGLKKPICVIPNGIDLPPSLEAPPPDWEDGGTRGAKVLLYLGRLHPIKNLLNLLRAWAAVQHGNQAARHWRLVVAGWDQNGYQAQIQRAARDLAIEGTVRFPGPNSVMRSMPRSAAPMPSSCPR